MGLLTGTSTFKMCYHRMPEVEQMLRTLEVNGALWHGSVGVEEHGEAAKLAGSFVGLLSAVSGEPALRPPCPAPLVSLI